MSRKQHFTCKRIFTVLLTCIFIVEGMFANSALVYAVGADEIEQVGMENDILAIDPVDVTPPTVLAVSFGDSIEDDFIVQASDDISGPKNGTLYLRSVNTGEIVSAEFAVTYHDDDQNVSVAYEDGNLHGKLPREKILNAGVFAIDTIKIEDYAGNIGEYIGKGNPGFEQVENELCLQDSVAKITVSVSEDTLAPEIKSIKIEKTELEGQDKTNIEVVLSDESGVKNCYVEFVCEDFESNVWYPKDGMVWESGKGVILQIDKQQDEDKENIKAKGEIKIGEVYFSGRYVVNSITVRDNVGNEKKYRAEELPDDVRDVSFEIKSGSSKSPIRSLEMKNKKLSVPCTETLTAHLVELEDPDSDGENITINFRNKKSGLTKTVRCSSIEKCIGSDGQKIDDEWNISFEINFEQNETDGIYVLDRLQAGIGVFYGKGNPDYESTSPEFRVPDEIAGYSFEVVNNEKNGDDEAPKIKSIMLGKTELEGQDKTNIEVVLSDESGVKNCYVEFVCEDFESNVWYPKDGMVWESGKGVILQIDKQQDEDKENIKAKGEIKIGEVYFSGRYVVNSITVRDNVGNEKKYRAEELPDDVRDVSFEIKSGSSKSPIRSLEMKNKKLNVPCTETLTAHLVELEDPDSDGENITINFRNKKSGLTKTVRCSSIEKCIGSDGRKIDDEWNISFEIKFEQNETDGIYVLDRLQAGIGVFYGKGNPDYESTSPEFRVPDEIASYSFEVVRVPVITVSILDEKLIEKIKALANDEAIAVEYSDGAIASSEIFSTIEGTQKEVIFTSNEVDWKFNGDQIDSSSIKEVDLSTTVTTIDEDETIKDDLESLVEDKATVIVEFADNGQLPGTATINVKTNEDINGYLGNEDLQVYYWNDKDNELEAIANDVVISSDNRISFDIEHCSYYIITGKRTASESQEVHTHGGANATFHEAVKATCTEAGNSAYYSCSCGKYFSDKACTKEINKDSWIVKAKGHDYGETTYEWSPDNKTVTAKKICKNNAAHIESETVNTTYEVITEPTQDTIGTGRYIANFTKEGFETQTKDVEIPKLEPKPSKGDVTKVFKDVLAGEWYVSAVQFVYDNSIMNGVSETSFAPKMTLTREQFITVLYNMEGAPEIEFKQIFDDVTDKNSWYAKSVTWASENKITSGIGNNLFGARNEITREQLATLLYNYAQQKEEYKLIIDANAVTNFPDAEQISTWASDGMKWAVTNGVMGGKTGKDGQNILDPQGKATRAECAQMIKNLKEKAVK